MSRFLLVLTPFALTLLACAPGPVASTKERLVAWAELEAELAEQPAEELQGRIARVLETGRTARTLSANENAAWQIMHGVACYGSDLLLQTPDRGEVSAVEYAFTGGQIHGLEMYPGVASLPATGQPGLQARLEPGSYIGQGHVDQWIAICAMADLPLETPIQLGNQQYSLESWVRQAQYDATQGLLAEYGWTLIALTHYLPQEPQWKISTGQTVSWEQLVDHEVRQGLESTACGGTHRLAGIVRALRAKENLGLPDTAVWQRARALVDGCIEDARLNRGADGRLSSYYFERPGSTLDATAELASAGHVIEFLALALPAEQELAAPWVEVSVNRLCSLLEATSATEMDCGALYHGLNGLRIYQERRFGVR